MGPFGQKRLELQDSKEKDLMRIKVAGRRTTLHQKTAEENSQPTGQRPEQGVWYWWRRGKEVRRQSSTTGRPEHMEASARKAVI